MLEVRQFPRTLSLPLVQKQQVLTRYEKLFDSDSLNMSLIQSSLQRPGLYKQHGIILQTLARMTPAVLFQVQQYRLQFSGIRFNGLYNPKKTQFWFQFMKIQERSYVGFNQKVAINPYIMKNSLFQIQGYYIGVFRFIQHLGMAAWAQTALLILQKSKILMVPTLLFSQLFSFVLQNGKSFKPSTYSFNRSSKPYRFNLNINQNLMTDAYQVPFTFLQLQLIQNRTPTQLDELFNSIKPSQSQIQIQYQQILNFQDQIQQIQNQIIKNFQRIKNTQQYFTSQQLVIVEPTFIKQQTTQNISTHLVQLSTQTKQVVQKSLQDCNRILQALTQTTTITVAQEQHAQAISNLQKIKTILIEKNSVISNIPQLQLQKLNNIPQDIQRRIIFVKSRRMNQKATLSTVITKYVAQMQKIIVSGTHVTNRDVDTIYKIRQQQVLRHMQLYITMPGQQIAVLQLKAQRIIEQNRVAQASGQLMQQVWGGVENLQGVMQNSFSQVKGQLLAFRKLYDQQRMVMIGLPHQIQNNFKILFQGMVNGFQIQTQYQIKSFNDTISRVQSDNGAWRMQITNTLQTMNGQLKQILDEIAILAQQISKIRTTTQQIRFIVKNNASQQQKSIVMINSALQQIKKMASNKYYINETNKIKRQQQKLQQARGKFALQKKNIQKQISSNELQLANLKKLKDDQTKSLSDFTNTISFDFVPLHAKLQENRKTLNDATAFSALDFSPLASIHNKNVVSMSQVMKPLQQGMDTLKGQLSKIQTQKKSLIKTANSINQIKIPEYSQKIKKITNSTNNYDKQISQLQKKINQSLQKTNRMNQQISTIKYPSLDDIQQKSKSFYKTTTAIKARILETTQTLNSQQQKLQKLKLPDLTNFTKNTQGINKNISVLQTVSNKLKQLTDESTLSKSNQKLSSFLELLTKNIQYLFGYQTEMDSGKISLSNKIDSIQKQLQYVIQNINGNGGGGGSGGSGGSGGQQQILGLKKQLQAAKKSGSVIRRALQALINTFTIFLGQQSERISTIIQQMFNNKFLEKFPKAKDILMQRLLQSHNGLYAEAKKYVMQGFTDQNKNQVRDQYFQDYVDKKIKSNKRYQAFQWWKSSDKIIKL